MQLATERTILRAFTPADIDDLLEIWTDPDVREMAFSDQDKLLTRASVEQTVALWLAAPSVFAIIEDKRTGAVVGQVGLLLRDHGSEEGCIGITLSRKFWGKGYGSEVLRWVIEYAFGPLQIYRLYLYVFEGNERGIALYRKLGFIHEKELAERVWVRGRSQKIILMGLLENEWDFETRRRREP